MNLIYARRNRSKAPVWRISGNFLKLFGIAALLVLEMKARKVLKLKFVFMVL